jgi:hypothetical protein
MVHPRCDTLGKGCVKSPRSHNSYDPAEEWLCLIFSGDSLLFFAISSPYRTYRGMGNDSMAALSLGNM